MKQVKSKVMTSRMIPFISMIIIVALIASATLIRYQIVDAGLYYELSQQNNTTKETVAAARGQITDRYGRVLVTNQLSLVIKISEGFPIPLNSDKQSDKIEKNKQGNQEILGLVEEFKSSNVEWIDEFPISYTRPYDFKKDMETQTDKLKNALSAQKYATAQNCMDLLIEKYDIEGYDEDQTRLIAGIRGQMLVGDYSSSNPYIFAKDIDTTFASKLMELKPKFPGIETGETSTRIYPCGDIASHIIGTVGPIFSEDYASYKEKGYPMNAIVGKGGIESSMEDELRGIDGKMTVVRNKEGQAVDNFFYDNEKPKPGNSVVLSIDSKLQKQLQDALANFVKSTGGKGAGMAVIDVKTGETLALVSYPGYDINEYSENYNQLLDNPLKPLNNRALMGLYRPGSSFKTFTSAAGMLNGTFSTGTYYNCSNPFPGTQMTCVQDKHRGPTNIYTALQRSCNNFFYNVAKNMGIDKIDEYAPSFGFGTDTGLEITNSNGRVTNPQYYQDRGTTYVPGFTYQTGIGQAEVMATPLQMAISMMTIANHGVRYASHLIKSVEKYDFSSNVKKTNPEILSALPDNNKAFSVTIDGMKMMAQTRGALSNLDIAVKSGSPQYDDNNKKKTHGAGVGIYPAATPEIGMGLIVEDGKNAQDFFAQVARIYEECKSEQLEQDYTKEQLLIK